MKSKLEVFVTAAECLSFTLAARTLSISQPAVTKNIREIENEYNIRLFERIPGGVSLTPEGELFLVHARKILSEYETLAEDIGSFSGADAAARRVLAIGATESVAAGLLPVIVEKYLSLFKNRGINLKVMPDTELFSMLQAGKLEVAIAETGCDMEHDYGELIDFPLLKYRMVVVAGRKNSIDASSQERFFRTARLVKRGTGGVQLPFEKMLPCVEAGSLDFAIRLLLQSGNCFMQLPSYLADGYISRGEMAELALPASLQPEPHSTAEGSVALFTSALSAGKGYIENFIRFVRRSLLPGL